MDLNENGSLVILEHLMEEFFNPSTSNSRKHEIEIQLNSLKTTPHLWKLCLYFISNTSSQYVTMFALSTLESVINQQWTSADWSYREELRIVLHNYLVEKGSSSPHFLRNKYAKLLVDIAKIDWPDRYPYFLMNILELLKTEPNQLIGLILLRTTSEEFMGLHAAFEASRKAEITRLLQTYIPVFFEVLTNILENLGAKPRHTATATPPPSPTHPTSTPNISQQLSSVASFRADTRALKKELLNTVQHLFTWVPANQIPPRIVKAIFQFTNISSYAQDDDDMSVLAMSTINELLYRKCVPPDSQEFFIHLYHHTVELLKDLVHSSSYRVDTIDLGFVEKLSELLVLLVEQHMWRLELDPSFSAVDFLQPLFQLTLQLPSVQCYLRCLAVWAAFIKQIKPGCAVKYSEALVGLVTALLKKMQFFCNCDQLKDINNSDYDDDNESEWTIYIKTTIEVIALIAKHLPVETFSNVLVPWKAAHDMYKRIEDAIDDQHDTLNFPRSETERLCYILKDFSTLTQCLARLSSLFRDQENEHLSSLNCLVSTLVEKLLESAFTAQNVRFYNLKLGDSRLADCFIDIHSQILAAIQTWLSWMSQQHKLSSDTITLVADVSLPLLHTSAVPRKISCAAAHLFLSLTSVVSPNELMAVEEVRRLIHYLPHVAYGDRETRCVIYSAVCNLLLRPWGIPNEEEIMQRNCMVRAFFNDISKDFLDLTTDSHENRVREVAGNLMPVLSHVVEFSKDFPVVSKKLLCYSIKPTIEHAIYLFPPYVKYTEVSDQILVFFLSVLGVLQQQLGVDSTRKAVEVFLQVAMREPRTNFVGVDKLLQIFQLIIESPGSSYKNFLPGILQLCMENIYPAVVSQAVEYPDIFIALLSLLYSILLHRWQYFYASQVRLGYSPGCSESGSGPDSPQKPEQLLAILQVFGQALLQQDINVFRVSLAALEDLNSKWKLYHKALFRNHLLSNFLTVLLHVLIEKSQDLLSEDIYVAIYNMASINFQEFLSTFLQQFICGFSDRNHHRELILKNFVQNHDRDMPTFIQHLQKFVNDVRQMRMCNLSQTVN